jgi:hypothetical protein
VSTLTVILAIVTAIILIPLAFMNFQGDGGIPGSSPLFLFPSLSILGSLYCAWRARAYWASMSIPDRRQAILVIASPFVALFLPLLLRAALN